MKIKHISMSLVALIAMGSQVVAQTPPAAQSNDSGRTGDFLGSQSQDFRVNDCGVNVPHADLAVASTAYQISTEYLMRKDYNSTITNPRFSLGIANPATVSDATIEIKFPTMINTASVVGMNIIDIDPDLDGDFSDAAIILAHSNSVPDKNIETFDAATSVDMVNGHKYCISDGSAPTATNPGCLALDVGIAQGTYADGTEFAGNIEWNVYSNSGTAERRDYVAMPLYYVVKDQFSIVCRSDFDGLINWENGRKSFVANKHDVDSNVNGFIPMTDVQDTVTDSLIFTISNLAGRTGLASLGSANPCGAHAFDTWLEGNATEFDISSTGDLTSANIPDAQRTLTSSSANVADGTGAYRTNHLTTFTTAAEPIPFGTTEYTIRFNNMVGYGSNAVIPATSFTGNVDLEADSNGSTYLHPQVSMPNDHSVGEWRDHAYIAQIAGASVLTGVNDTKVFIVNRSCVVVTPQFKLIKDGVVTPVTTGVASINVNNQGVYKVSKMISDMNLAEGAYALEVTLPGIAEDFYMYAQVKNTSGANTQFKDLPVYNTSTRD